MKRPFRMLGSFILAGALAAPIAMPTQDRDHDKDRERERNNDARIYAREHRDYHTWNNDQDYRYRQWYTNTDSRREYRDYRKLHKKDQQAYWNWRHNHGDDDHDREDRH